MHEDPLLVVNFFERGIKKIHFVFLVFGVKEKEVRSVCFSFATNGAPAPVFAGNGLLGAFVSFSGGKY